MVYGQDHNIRRALGTTPEFARSLTDHFPIIGIQRHIFLQRQHAAKNWRMPYKRIKYADCASSLGAELCRTSHPSIYFPWSFLRKAQISPQPCDHTAKGVSSKIVGESAYRTCIANINIECAPNAADVVSLTITDAPRSHTHRFLQAGP